MICRIWRVWHGTVGKSVRGILAVLTLAYVYYMYLNADIITDVKDIGLQSHDDIIKWGRNYINFNFTATKDNVITYEAFEDDAEDGEEPLANQSSNNSNATNQSFNSTDSKQHDDELKTRSTNESTTKA